MLLTGDNAAVAARVAAEVGIAAADVIAGVLPSEKADTISALQARGRRSRRRRRSPRHSRRSFPMW